MKLWKSILKFIRDSKYKPVYKGKDLYGNIFFEGQYFGRKKRHVELVTTNLEFSHEWAAWLRYMRDDVPTEEEMLRNAAISYLTKERSKQLLEEEKKKFPEYAAKLEQVAKEGNLSLRFPTYEEYEASPGQSIKYLPYGYRDINEQMKLIEESKKKILEIKEKEKPLKLEEKHECSKIEEKLDK